VSSDVVTLDGGSSAAEYRQSVGRMSTVSRWTNASVRQLAGDRDPIDEITTRARARVLDGLDRGWVGPPFDPLALARLSGIQVVGRDSIPDAQTVVDIGGKLVIEVNPNRPRARLRYSIAHELGHTLFPDCAKHVRNRSAYHEMVGDEWQLEALCNIAAAEFLMPTGSFPELREETLSIDRILALRQLYEVSMEAVLIRFVRLVPPRLRDAGSHSGVNPSTWDNTARKHSSCRVCSDRVHRQVPREMGWGRARLRVCRYPALPGVGLAARGWLRAP